ncbi:unnamed protein product [marine sediment metagenome]|uniref:Restriction endonuclease type IV Mrr domain-containing protein n=1 Tax=marine sediment metagenome TaxID=412755 RepID=X1TBX3_9ZZZZ
MPSQYGKGAKFEIEVRDILLEDDWVAIRSAGSHGIIDVLGIKVNVKWFIQCRTKGNLSGSEREELVALAKKHDATPILAYKEGGNTIFEEVKLLKPNFHYEMRNGRFTKVDNE